MKTIKSNIHSKSNEKKVKHTAGTITITFLTKNLSAKDLIDKFSDAEVILRNPDGECLNLGDNVSIDFDGVEEFDDDEVYNF
ncbi:hypothetical protein ACA30_05755 [Virgibacillus soli]|nr:hypothetical protein ACA30_05755 [Virgibacillus soli]